MEKHRTLRRQTLKTTIMSIIIFFLVVIVFSLVLNAVDKIRSFKQVHKSLWEDGDSVYVRKGSVDPEVREHNFMTRLS